ncbi:MAG: LPS export ABC transporter periplasmic protein LptC [Flavobacterium sp.]|nr:LPS export ABC transporter periplasmic protein LptC [Flavobacterium sp.]
MIGKKKIFSFFCLVLVFAMSTACESNLKEVQKSTFSEFSPSGEADSLTLKYTDSGKIQAVLETSKMKDFGSVIFPFTEFPKGILLTLYDKNAKKTYVKSDFATQYKLSEIIDLRGNVKITSDQGAFLETQQLYYDQKNEWFYTEKFFKLTDPKNGNTSGEGVDFNKDFTIINYQKVKGIIEQVK